MGKKREPEPNRLLQSGYMLLSRTPLVGVIVLETDEGIAHFAVNETVAKELRDNLNRFLSGMESLHR